MTDAGAPRTYADRTAAAARLLRSHPQWSNRWIASVTGLSSKTVAAIRRRVCAESPQPQTRIGRDGRVRPLNSSQGRRLASQLMLENPNASLREIGLAARISPTTARDVRERLRRGDDPVPERQRQPSTTDQQHRVVALPSTPRSRLDSLRRDPSLRFTEDGRLLLRLLDVIALDPTRLDRMAHNVPDHCLDLVAELAGECARFWQAFAEAVRPMPGDMSGSR
jgi:hypothetical protein